ncbi:MAG TPA: 2OG-Fe(II) oxygenase, partial [Bradyrhizobium sp.]
MTATAKTIARSPVSGVPARVDGLAWDQITADLDGQGCAVLGGLLTPEECDTIAALYPNDGRFRSRVVMGRHGFGRGEYKYFSYPLPDLIAELRPALYARLTATANRWNKTMGIEISYPPLHAAFLKRCHDAGQTRPTPLLLQYGEGDYNCLHQDL